MTVLLTPSFPRAVPPVAGPWDALLTVSVGKDNPRTFTHNVRFIDLTGGHLVSQRIALGAVAKFNAQTKRLVRFSVSREVLLPGLEFPIYSDVLGLDLSVAFQAHVAETRDLWRADEIGDFYVAPSGRLSRTAVCTIPEGQQQDLARTWAALTESSQQLDFLAGRANSGRIRSHDEPDFVQTIDPTAKS